MNIYWLYIQYIYISMLKKISIMIF